MKRFILKVALFTFLLVSILTVSTIYIPNNVLKKSLYYSIIDKHELLRKSQSPKLIFIGASNISFGLDSEKISKAFNMDVINMGIHAGFGIKYIANDIKDYISSRDIIIIVPEYDYFYKNKNDIANGRQELLYLMFDIYPEGRKHIQQDQWLHLLGYIPKYATDKLSFFLRYQHRSSSVNINNNRPLVGIYDRAAFNKYGDAVAHWGLPNEKFSPYDKSKDEINHDIIQFLNQYNDEVADKGARLYFIYPCFQAESFENKSHSIKLLENELNQLNFPILSTPERYKFPDDYFFNTPYHLNKNGVDVRTRMIIEDLSPIINKAIRGER